MEAEWDAAKDWSVEECQTLRNDVPAKGFDEIIRGRTVREIAGEVLKISRAGLDYRDFHGCKGKLESGFLDVLDESVVTGKTAADQLLELYNGAWNGDISRVFRDFAY